MSQVKIGDVVAWDKVPSGALVRSYCENSRFTWWYLRHGDRGTVAGLRSAMDSAEQRPGSWWAWGGQNLPVWALWSPPPHVTVIALGLTGQETAAELQQLAEVYEVREAIRATEWPWSVNLSDAIYIAMGEMAAKREDWLGYPADRLHAAKWRPGMTAEDAAWLLAGAGQ